MKKLIIAGLSLAIASTALAQPDVIKAAERAMKSKAPAAVVIETITPALTDPVLSELAQTWYIPGKACFNEFDEYFVQKQFGNVDPSKEETVNNDLLEGYNYFLKAQEYDMLPNEKGQVKPKYTKDIINTNSGHINDFFNAGAYFWDKNEYKKAYDAWGIYVDIASDPRSKLPVAVADTTLGEIIFNQALAAWQAEDLGNALAAFKRAMAKGYVKKNVYDYAIAVAYQDQNEDEVFALSQEALPLYGKEDNTYMNMIINHYIQKNEYDKATEIIDSAIAEDPANPQYYVIKGVLFEQLNNAEAAAEAYQKALEIDADYAAALANLGRLLYDKAGALADAAPLDQQEFNKYYVETLKPAMLKAVEVLEHAYTADNENIDNLRLLENLYYNLNDEKMLEETKLRMQ